MTRLEAGDLRDVVASVEVVLAIDVGDVLTADVGDASVVLVWEVELRANGVVVAVVCDVD